MDIRWLREFTEWNQGTKTMKIWLDRNLSLNYFNSLWNVNQILKSCRRCSVMTSEKVVEGDKKYPVLSYLPNNFHQNPFGRSWVISGSTYIIFLYLQIIENVIELLSQPVWNLMQWKTFIPSSFLSTFSQMNSFLRSGCFLY